MQDFSHGIGFNAVSLSGAADEKSKEYARSVIQKSLSKQFAPEFLNRLDDIITFEQLDAAAIRKIVDIELTRLIDRMKEIGYSITVSDAAKDFLATKGYDQQFGARPLKRAIQNYIEDELCDFLLSGNVKKGATVKVEKTEDADKLNISVCDCNP